MENNLFSIIIPIYNSEQYIEECLNSIVRQTYRNFELILINDGSTDDSMDIISRLSNKDSRVKIVDKKNAGVSAARNDGIKNAIGDYVIFIDSDDYLIGNTVLEKLNSTIDESADMVVYNINIEGVKNRFDLPSKVYRGNELNNFLFSSIKYETINSPCNKVYSKKIIDNYNIRFDVGLKIGEDLLFNIQYLKHSSSIYYIKDTLYFYRRTSVNSATKKILNDKYNNLMYVNHELVNWLKSRDSDRLLNIAKYIKLKNILSCLRSHNIRNNKITEKDLRKIITNYKNNNPKIIIKKCGTRMYLISILYSLMSITMILRIISKVYGAKK